MKLYQYPEAFEKALSELSLAEETGDPALYDAAMAKLQQLDAGRDEKLAACCKYERELLGEVEKIEKECARLDTLLKRADARLKSWREYIGGCLGYGNTWKNEFFKLSWRESQAVEVLDEAAIPSIYMREKTVKTVDKKALLEDLKLGATVPGVELGKRWNLQIK